MHTQLESYWPDVYIILVYTFNNKQIIDQMETNASKWALEIGFGSVVARLDKFIQANSFACEVLRVLRIHLCFITGKAVVTHIDYWNL